MPETRRHRSRRDRDLVPIRRSRRGSSRATSVRLERTWRRSDEGARHRRATRDRCGEESRIGCVLERFVRLAHVAGSSLEAGEFFEEGERNLADRTVALLGDDQFGLASFFHTRLFVFLVEFWPDEQGDQISVLFDG